MDQLDRAIRENQDLEALESNLEVALKNLKNEIKCNAENIELLEGKVVTYGSTVQLLNIESGKVIIANNSETSITEKDCLSVSMEYEKYATEGSVRTLVKTIYFLFPM